MLPDCQIKENIKSDYPFIILVVEGEGKLFKDPESLEESFDIKEGKSFFIPARVEFKLSTKSGLIVFLCSSHIV